MDSQQSEMLFTILVENCARILEAQFGVDKAEPCFFQIIELLRQEPFLKPLALSKIEHAFDERDAWGLRKGALPLELVELIAHELQWPELERLAEDACSGKKQASSPLNFNQLRELSKMLMRQIGKTGSSISAMNRSNVDNMERRIS